MMAQGESYDCSPWETDQEKLLGANHVHRQNQHSFNQRGIASDHRISHYSRNDSRKSLNPSNKKQRQSLTVSQMRDKTSVKFGNRKIHLQQRQMSSFHNRNKSEHLLYVRYCSKKAQRSIQLYLQKVRRKIKKQKIQQCLCNQQADLSSGRFADRFAWQSGGLWWMQKKDLLHKMHKAHPPANFVYFNRNFT